MRLWDILVIIVAGEIFIPSHTLASDTSPMVASILSIPAFKLPKPHIASALMVIEVRIRIVWHQIARTQIAEVRVAFEADHVIAAHGFLCRCCTCWTRRGVAFDVVDRGLLFCSHLLRISRIAMLNGSGV